jgi:nitroreductase
MDIRDAIRRRRSIRRFTDRPIPDHIIAELIESARLAPSGGNGQGWLFGAVTDRSLISRLSEAAGGQDWITTAPLVIALCAELSGDLATLPEDDFRLAVDRARFTPDFISYLRNYADQRAVSLLFSNSAPLIPGEHIFLTSVSHGLGACWVGFLDVDEASAILELPDNYACLFLMPIGYPAEEPKPQQRKPVTEITFRDNYKPYE